MKNNNYKQDQEAKSNFNAILDATAVKEGEVFSTEMAEKLVQMLQWVEDRLQKNSERVMEWKNESVVVKFKWVQFKDSEKLHFEVGYSPTRLMVVLVSKEVVFKPATAVMVNTVTEGVTEDAGVKETAGADADF